MPRFAANLSMMFTELPFKARFAAARMAGFKGVEFLFPYDYDAGDLAAELMSHDLTQVLFNLYPGDFNAGERGLAALPGREADFETSVTQALDYAGVLGCKLLHCMAGVPKVLEDPEKIMNTYISNLQRAAAEAGPHDVTILIEPINQRDNPGYYLSDIDSARRIIEAVAADNVRLQLDLYHRQVTRGDLIHAIRDNLDITSHIQIANPPDRADPGTGEINYPYIFAVLDEHDYTGWIGCEYKPPAATKDSLDWFEPYKT
jgi:hydroxypyruvate isomerase